MPQSLRQTWALIVLALLAILPVAFLSLRDAARDIFPACKGALEIDVDSPESPLGASVARDERQPGGFALRYDIATKRTGGYELRITRMEDDAADDVACECATIAVPVSTSSWSAFDIKRTSPGNYIVVEGYGKSARVIAAFRTSDKPIHSFQPNRLIRRRHMPAVVVMFALFALGIAGLRARKGIAYASRMHGWTEASLDGGGRIENDLGETLGVLDSTGRKIFPGKLLVAPEATAEKGLYRDLPIIARRFVAMGTHARWSEWTMRGLRDARALCAISVACSLLALGARFLGG